MDVPSRPLTPQVLCSETSENSEASQVSVRDLKSRFESSNNTDVKRESSTDSRGKPVGFPESRGSFTGSQSSDTGRVPFQRQRSKSESESQAQQTQKPKSVLAKKGKNGDRLNKPRKSVTFSTNVCLVEAADAWDSEHMAGYQSDEEGLETRQISERRTEDTDSSTSDSPVEIIGDSACMLCHKQGVEQGQHYCNKCTYYMNQFAPS